MSQSVRTGMAAHLAVIDGQVTTTTLDIARVYGKRHDNVLRIVRQRMADCPPDWCLLNFEEASIELLQTNGGTVSYPVIRLTKKGFNFVVGKFTGAKAVQHQIAFADEFERMEAELAQRPQALPAPAIPEIDVAALLLSGQSEPVPLTPEQYRLIDQRAYALSADAHALIREHLLRAIAYRSTWRDREEAGSIVWQAALPKGCSKAVLACLAWHAVMNEHDQCWPHVDTLARLCCLQRRATMDNLKALAEAGLITSTSRPGTSNLYRLNRAALVALSSELPAATNAARGAENAAAHAENDMGGAEKAQNLSFSAPIREKERREKEEEREREECAHAPETDQVEAAAPPLPVLEDLKTNPVDDVLARISGMPVQHLPYIAQSVTRLIEAEQTGKAQQRRLVVQVASALCAPQAPAAPATMAQPSNPAPAAAPAIDQAQLAALNARRIAGGKAALTARDLRDLAAEASLAGRTVGNLVELINARNWLFARAEWKGVKVDTALATLPSEQTPQARAAAEAHAARLRAINGTGTPASATTVAACMARLRTAPLAMGSTGTGWARDAVDRFITGQAVAHATISSAASALKLSLVDLKAQRAAALQAEGVAA